MSNTRWTIKRIIAASIVVIVLIVGVSIVSESGKLADVQCSNDGYTTRYIGWDDNAGPCSYSERVVSFAFSVIFLPMFVLWPVAALYLLVVGVASVIRPRLRIQVLRIILFEILLLLLISLATAIFFGLVAD